MKEKNEKIYTPKEVRSATLEYFNGDELATDVWINKYCLKDSSGNLFEKSPDDMHKRLAKEFYEKEKTYKNTFDENLSEYGKKREELTEERIYEYFKDFKYISPQGSIMSVLGNDNVIGSLSNCVVIPKPKDSLGGILFSDQQLAQLFKRRCGVGIDISSLRPENSPVTNAAGTSTGAVSFMERFSNTTREIGQSGRRGALMITIDNKHPDVFEFVKIKRDLKKVTGANISIQLRDDFMNAVVKEDDYLLTFPVDMKIPLGDYYDDVVSNLKYNETTEIKNVFDSKDKPVKVGYLKLIKARELWDEIIQSAHASAEPGLIFKDRQHVYSTSSIYPNWENITTNPCFSGNERLLTTQGYKTFEELSGNNFEIINSSGNVVPSKVWCSGIKDTINIHNSEGDVITCTPDHIWKTIEGDEVMAKDLLGKRLQPFSGNHSPKIIKIENNGPIEVYDFNDPENGWGVVNGYIAHNCSEIAMNDDSCRLMIVNLFGCVENPFTDKAKINYEKLYEISYESQRLIDDLVDLELDAVERIINKIKYQDDEPDYIKQVELDTWKNLHKKGKEGRRTGLGFTGLGDVIAALGHPYDSEKGMQIINKMMEVKFMGEFDSSIDMAIQRGKFKDFNPEYENKSEFVHMIKNEYPEMYDRMMKFGRRNISISTVAPTGSLSILTQTTSGVEPLFMIGYKRRRKLNSSEKNIVPSFIDEMGDKWVENDVLHYRVKQWLNINNINSLERAYTDSPYVGSTAPEIDWIKRVKIQSIIQKWVTHSISSTINLPKDVSKERVGEIYIESWKKGLKGITVYRDGSRDGVLISNTDKKEEKRLALFKETNAPKRPKRLKADIVRFQNNLEKWVAVVGVLDDRPYEIFTGKLINGLSELPMSVKDCEIVKIIQEDGKKRYDVEYVDSLGERHTISGLSKTFNSEYWNYAKLISGVLRHGMPLVYVHEIIDSLDLKDDNLNTWKNGVARVIKKYIKDGEKAKGSCNECGSEHLEYKEGCLTCMSCGSSKCS